MSTNDRDPELPRLHVVVTESFRHAFDDARRDPLVFALNEGRARAETKDCLIKFIPTRNVDSLRWIRVSSYAIHWTTLRDSPRAAIAEIRNIMSARRIPEISFLSGQRATPLQAETIEGERVLHLVAKASEIGGEDPEETYRLLICATAFATLRKGGDQWQAFTDFDVALQEIRKATLDRPSAPVTL